IDLSDLFKDRRLTPKLRVTGANAPKLATDQILSAAEQIAIGIELSRTMNDAMGSIDRTLPGHAAIGGTAKFARRTGKVFRPKLVVKSVTWPAGLINLKPLLIASPCPRKTGP